MIAHTLFSPQVANPIRGMQAFPPANHANIENKSSLDFTYTYRNLTAETRIFTMHNYWYPFTVMDVSSVPDFIQNPEW
jgi:hypothetical protein